MKLLLTTLTLGTLSTLPEKATIDLDHLQEKI
jgi:hypothetical protein